MNKDVIPKGDYCYDENGRCPYWSKDKTLPEQENGRCAFLGKSDWDLNEEKYITEYWVGKKHIQLDRAHSSHELGFPGGGLLWDECKECGINRDVA